MPLLCALAMVWTLWLTACPPSVTPLGIPEGCQPLAADLHCGMPFPSDAFLVDDDALPSGHRVEIPLEAELLTESGGAADITEFLPQDGFSRLSPIVCTFGVGVDPASVPGATADPSATTTKDFPIALIRASDSARVPFYVDVDPRAASPERQALILRPLQRLDAETRYVVAWSGLKDTDGEAVPVPEAFRRLREGADAVGVDDPVLTPLLTHYEDAIFPALEKAGLAREALQLAWDFTTGSDTHVTHDLLRARALALTALETTPPTVRLDAVFADAALARVLDNVRPENAWRLVRFEITGPRVVETDRPGTLLSRDDAGEVQLNGETTFEVTAIIPASVRDQFGPADAILYGHGFFGSQNEIEFTNRRAIANEAGRILFAIDWVGMSLEDIGVVSGAIGNQVYEALRFGERLPQAMVNWLTLTKVLRDGQLDDLVLTTSAGELRPFRRPDDVEAPGVSSQNGASNAGAPLLVMEHLVFQGHSAGHILGGVQTALNADVERVVLSAGGVSFANMMFRARPFEGFTFFLDRSVPDPLDQQLLAAQLQRGFDRFDPGTYAPYIIEQPLPEGPDNGVGGGVGRRVLMMYGRGDSQVPNLGTQMHMRLLGLPWVTPNDLPQPFALDAAASPVGGSGAFAVNMGADPSFEAEATFPEETPVHDGMLSLAEVQALFGTFMREGVIENPCGADACGVLSR